MRTKIQLYILSMFTAFAADTAAQETTTLPKNYAGINTVIDFNSESGAISAEYERLLFQTEKKALGVKGSFVFPHKQGNLDFIWGPSNSKFSQAQLMATGYAFVSPKRPYGIFLRGGIAVAANWWNSGENNTGSGSKNTINSTGFGFEAGFGWHFDIGGKMNVKWTNTLSLFSSGRPAYYSDYQSVNQQVYMLSGFAIGF